MNQFQQRKVLELGTHDVVIWFLPYAGEYIECGQLHNSTSFVAGRFKTYSMDAGDKLALNCRNKRMEYQRSTTRNFWRLKKA